MSSTTSAVKKVPTAPPTTMISTKTTTLTPPSKASSVPGSTNSTITKLPPANHKPTTTTLTTIPGTNRNVVKPPTTTSTQVVAPPPRPMIGGKPNQHAVLPPKPRSTVPPPPKRKALVAPPPTPNISQMHTVDSTLQQQQEQLMYLQNFQYAQYPASLIMLQQQQAAAHQQHMLQQALLHHQQQQQQKTIKSDSTEESTDQTGARAKKRPRLQMESPTPTATTTTTPTPTTTTKPSTPSTANHSSIHGNTTSATSVTSPTPIHYSKLPPPPLPNKMMKMKAASPSPAISPSPVGTPIISTPGTTATTTPTPQTTTTTTTGNITTLEDAHKRIKELEDEVKRVSQKNTQLMEQNQQKQNTIQFLTQQNMTLMVQVQQMAATSQHYMSGATQNGPVTSPVPNMKPTTPSLVPLSPLTHLDSLPATPSLPTTPLPPHSPQKGLKKPKKLDEVEAVIYVDSIETIQPSNVENELKKFFAKVNNGGKRGIQAVHAGDGLDTVARAVVVALKQVDRLRDRAVYEEQHQNDERCAHCINLCLQLLQVITRSVCTGLLTLLDSAISQLMDGSRSSYGLDWADQLETSWKSIFDLIFVESDQTSYTPLGALLDFNICQHCLEELQAFGKSLSYFKMEHMTRMFKVMFTYMKRHHDMEWYLQFCLQIKYYKEYCARMVEMERYQECLQVIIEEILTGPNAPSRSGSYTDEDKTYLIEYAVLCLRHVIRDDIEAQTKAMESGDTIPPALYSQMIETIMANCVNTTPSILFPREIVPLLIFLLELFPSSEAFTHGGETGQDIRHLTFIADLLFIIVRNIVELDDYDESIDSVKTVGRRIVLECTNSLLEKLLQVKQSPIPSRLKEIIETDAVFKRSIAQICEKAIWIPIHMEEKDHSWKSVHDYLDTLQIRQDDHSEPLRRSVLRSLRLIVPSVSDYLDRMIRHLYVALEFKIENRNNSSYDGFFAEMKAIGNHYFRSGREKQWDELLNKIFLIHSRKVKLKKMLKRWNAEQAQNRISTPWYDDLLDDEDEYTYGEEVVEEMEDEEEEEDDEADDEMTMDHDYHHAQ